MRLLEMEQQRQQRGHHILTSPQPEQAQTLDNENSKYLHEER